MRFGVGVAVVALCCVAPVVRAQTDSIPSATNPGDMKEMPGKGMKATAKVPAAAVSSAAAAGSSAAMVDPAKSMDAVLTGIEKDVVALAEAMPADKYSFQPKNSDFAGGLTPNYDGVRTFGQEILPTLRRGTMGTWRWPRAASPRWI